MKHSSLLCSCLVATACTEPVKTTRAPEAAPVIAAEPEPLRLVVLLVVDQLPAWSFDPQRELLTAGIARLLREGVYFSHGEYPYAVTYTAPGHATLGTGTVPAEHGIVANHWYDRELGRNVDVDDDDSVRTFVFTEDGRIETGQGSSSRALRVEGIADALEAQTRGRASTFAIGLKPRSGGLVLGRRPDLAVWLAGPHMTTGTAFVREPPAWLVGFDAEHGPRTWPAWVWEPSIDPARFARYVGPDDQAGEADPYGLGRTFPHRLDPAQLSGKALALTPLADRLTVDVALLAIQHQGLGTDDVPDLLGISFSAHDYVGHAWGQESWERLDVFLRLDAQIGRLLDALDARVGRGRYAVVFTSDHGATPLVERSRAEGRAAGRITDEQLRAAALRGLRSVLGKSAAVASVDASSVYVSPDVLTAPPAERAAALAAVAREIAAIPGIAFAAPTSEVAGNCDARPGIEALVCRSTDPTRSGDVMFVPAPLHLASGDYDTGTAHGSPADHDRVVPIVVMAPGVPPGRVDEAMSMLRVAPTLARLLGISPPTAAREPALPLDPPR